MKYIYYSILGYVLMLLSGCAGLPNTTARDIGELHNTVNNVPAYIVIGMAGTIVFLLIVLVAGITYFMQSPIKKL